MISCYCQWWTNSYVDPSDPGPGNFPVDSMDVCPTVTGETDKPLHDEIVLGYDFDNSHPDQGESIAGNYKLVVGPQAFGCSVVSIGLSM